jgi:hypothetical protein
MTEGMMGRTSDTRIYNPRSESSTMFRNNDGDGNYNPGDPKYEEQEKEKKQNAREKQAKKERSRKHIKVRPSMLREFDSDEDGIDDSKKVDADREIHAQTGAAGNFGFLSSLAGGAKGPGAARGEMVAMSEPMEVAFRLLKAYEDEHLQSYLDGDIDELGMFGHSFDQNRFPFLHVNANHPFIHDNDNAVNELMDSEEGYEAFEPALRNYENELKALHDHMVLSGSPQGSPPQLANGIRALVNDYREQSGVHDMTQEDVMRVSMAMYMSTLKALKLKNAQPSFDPSMMGDMKSEPMDDAWSSLMKERTIDICNECGQPYDSIRGALSICSACTQNKLAQRFHEKGDFELAQYFAARPEYNDPNWQDNIEAGEPMGDAWSELLKSSAKDRANRRKKEAQKKFKPSTEEFKRPVGGYDPKSATSRRAKFKSRALGGKTKRTGLGRAHLAVEMEHRGIKTKQPLRLEDPRKYMQQIGRQQVRVQQGQVRTPASPSIPQISGYSTRGAPRPKLKPMRAPPINPPVIAGAPHLNMSGGTTGMGMGASAPPPPMPIMASEDLHSGSDLQKRFDWATIQQLRHMLSESKRLLREKERKRKGKGDADTSGGGTMLPNHPSNGPKQTTRPSGATEDAKNDPRHFGAHTIGNDVGRGGRTA